MRGTRRKISAPYRAFNSEIDKLIRLDAQNQNAFTSGTSPRITKHQFHLLTETILFTAYRAYENFLEDIFQLYCLEKPLRSGRRVRSYLRPRDFSHAREMIKSSGRYLDWSNAGNVIKRAEIYLGNGFPVKLPFTTHKTVLEDLERLRNHIAHDSQESFNGYVHVLRRHYNTLPLTTPTPGEFLLLTNRIEPSKYNLLYYLDVLKLIADELT